MGMYFDFSDDQEELRETVRRFLASEAPTEYARSMYDDVRGTTTRVWSGLAGLDVTGLLVPKRFGGLGGGLVDMGVVVEELGRAVHPGPFLSTSVTATVAILAAGTPEDQAALLPALAAGDRVATLALLEPGRRYQWRTPSTMAVPAADGSWSLTGTKVHVPDAVAADWLLVTAAVNEGGLGLFLVDRAAVSAADPEDVLDGTRKQATVTLDAATGRRVGGSDATAAVARAIDRTIVALVIDAVGAAQAALDMTLAYVGARTQFGKPVGAFQQVQRHCVEAFQQIEMARTVAYYAMWAADDTDADEAHRAAVMAKAFASDALPAACALTVQAHGGIGVTWEYDLHLFYKRCLSMQSAYGHAAEHYDDVASIIVDLPAAVTA